MPPNYIIPDVLASKLWVLEKYCSQLQHPLKDCVEKLILSSDFALRQINTLLALLSHDSCSSLLSREEYFSLIKTLNMDSPVAVYSAQLRYFRHTHFLRLLVLELSGLATTEEVMQSWSDCADVLILQGLSYCQRLISARYGTPHDDEGSPVQLFVLAMGKLGGRELNYSSDIDLIFAFTAAGTTAGEEQITNQQYFTKVVQQFVQIMQQVTIDGFVFRVDLRLRPNGDSGALVSSVAAMETYYQEQGRDWERYAMVKARIINETVDSIPSWFARLIIPFVYRRYVDFSVIESLRSMKAMIEREVQLNPRLDDIKRGQGGIREIEFIIQNVQLIRGGRLPQLQQKNAMAALAVLKKEHLLPRCDALRQAYLFFRRLENVLQSLNDQQTHSLPEEEVKQAQVILAMGYEQWDDLLVKLHQYQRIVSHSFRSVLGKIAVFEDEKRLLTHQLASLWQGHIETNMAVNLLASMGFDHPNHCYHMLYSFRHGPRCRRLSQGARMRLDRFIVLLLSELMQVTKTDEVLLQVIQLLENIVGRSAYLALLTENPHVLKELLFWFANSPFMTALIVNQPFLLEVLLDQEKNWCPTSQPKLEALLKEQLSHIEGLESQEELLRQFKLTQWLLAARAELYGDYSAVRIGQFLADVAHVIIAQVLIIATEQLAERYPEIRRIKSHFAIIAYGKLGSREMNYNSDLDLVFLYEAKESDALVVRLTQKILHMLTIRSQAGVLFSVDTRLRPSGSAGLLVSPMDAFLDYQKKQAWTWEHQSLLKARILSGNSKLKQKFMDLKKEVFSLTRDRMNLQNDILNMRAKIDQNQESDSLKHAPGGLLDIEFLVQFLALCLKDAEIARYTHTLSQLKKIRLAGLLTQEQFILLKKAYSYYHNLLHQEIVRSEEHFSVETQSRVLEICKVIYALG
jgi:glutamate-ammonia-ligase adenylyltransferase